ncbi:MAG TPA: nucleotidyl transferase AbiEii/AbiGii toxin family protein [Thermoanaerobaculia bacterium]|nr:nucleotidyl transferase AbiEii/AbiGii toxin family protein [Thermoanaerobaculia bacterium]
MVSGLTAGFLLDRQWHWLRGEMDQSKRPALLTLCRILADEHVPYAIIGGLALQVHHREPRTTLDIDIAVLNRETIPRDAMRAAGFEFGAVLRHSEHWAAADGTPVQFSDDPVLAHAVTEAVEVVLEGVTLRVIAVKDLLHEKLRAGSDPARRRSKRLQDLADVQSLLEEDPGLAHELTETEQALLDKLPR